MRSCSVLAKTRSFGAGIISRSRRIGVFLVWEKTNIPEKFTMAMAEYAWCSFDNNAKVVKLSSSNIVDRFHPTQKPEELYRWIYRQYAKPGYKILDTHLGSGSSRRAAYDFGFEFVGCEIDKEYFEKQEQAFAAYVTQKESQLQIEI